MKHIRTIIVSTIFLVPALAFAGGAALPFALTCVVLAVAGVFGNFWFWVFRYAAAYVSEVSPAEVTHIFIGTLVRPDTPPSTIVNTVSSTSDTSALIWRRRMKEKTVLTGPK